MARDATLTRARLIRAAERRFARDGIAGTRLSDIVRDAQQANDSAVGYHFGSRQGLLEEVVARHFAAMEKRRVLPPDCVDVRELVALIVEPTASLLSTPEGRDFLRIMAQLADWSGVGSGQPNDVLVGSVLGAQLELLGVRLRELVDPAVARERVALLVTFLTAALAERARAVEGGRRRRLSQQRYVDHLVGVLTAALTSPV